MNICHLEGSNLDHFGKKLDFYILSETQMLRKDYLYFFKIIVCKTDVLFFGSLGLIDRFV